MTADGPDEEEIGFVGCASLLLFGVAWEVSVRHEWHASGAVRERCVRCWPAEWMAMMHARWLQARTAAAISAESNVVVYRLDR